MSGLIDTTEMYLKTIYELIEDGVAPLRARIVERLGHSGPTVSQTVGRMERDGLLRLDNDRQIEFTAAGFATAVEVMRKHRLAERLLVDVIGLEWTEAHDEACRWEHVMGRKVEDRLVELLRNPAKDPYGNPIPPRQPAAPAPAAIGVNPEEVSVQTLFDNKSENTAEVTLERIGEVLQVDMDVLANFAAARLYPGVKILVTRVNNGFLVQNMEQLSVAVDTGLQPPLVSLSHEQSQHLFIVF